MNKKQLQQIIKEELRLVRQEDASDTFKAFGGIHSDQQLDSLENSLKIYRSKDPKVWEKYIAGLKEKGYDNPANKEYPHFKWAMGKYTQALKLSGQVR